MYPLGIVPPDAAATIKKRLVDAFGDHGRVAVVTDGGDTGVPSPGAHTTYRIGEGGTWEATGQGLDVDAALDRLALTHEYAILVGFPDATVPHLVVGDHEFGGDVLRVAPDPASVDPEAIRDALEATPRHVTLETLIERAKNAPETDRAGAVATFTGQVRERDTPEDTPTTHLEFETYKGVADERMAALESELESREGVFAVRMHHRTGVIESGEDIVFVVVLAGHREEAFETVSDGIDRLKAEVPIFKKEVTVEDAFWRHEQ